MGGEDESCLGDGWVLRLPRRQPQTLPPHLTTLSSTSTSATSSSAALGSTHISLGEAISYLTYFTQMAAAEGGAFLEYHEPNSASRVKSQDRSISFERADLNHSHQHLDPDLLLPFSCHRRMGIGQDPSGRTDRTNRCWSHLRSSRRQYLGSRVAGNLSGSGLHRPHPHHL